MSKQTLFEYVILYHPKPKKAKEGEDYPTPKSVVLTGVKRVVARNDNEVGMLAARESPTELLDKLDEVEIVIRPF